MNEIDPSANGKTAFAPGGSPAGAAGDDSAPSPVRSDAAGTTLLARLQSLQEMQAALLIEEREEEILRVGVTATVEILGADCGVAVLETAGAPGSASPPTGLRCGWSEGRRLARHEIEILYRSLQEQLRPIREGTASRVVLAADPHPAGGADDPREAPAGEPPASLQSRRLGSVLVQAIGNGAARRGVLILAGRTPAPFSRETTLLVEILANQIVVHLERARRAAEAHRASDRVHEEVESATRDLRERNLELAALNAVAATAIPSFDLDRQLETALRKAIEVTSHAAGAIYLVETEEGGEEALRFAYAIGEPAYVERARGQGGRRGERVPGRVWATGKPLALADLSSDPEIGGCESLAAAGYRGLLCLPMRARGRTIGVLELLASEIRPYADDQVNLAQAVADQVGCAVQNTRLFSDVMRYSLELEGRAEARAREAEARDRQLGALRGLLEAAGRAAGADDLLEASLGRLLDLLGAECGAACTVDPDTRRTRLRARRDLSDEAARELENLPAEEAFLHRAAISGEMVVATSLSGGQPGLEGALGRAGLRFAAAVPLRARGVLQGLVMVAARDEPILGQEERAVLACFGTLAGMVIESAGPAPKAPPRGIGVPAPETLPAPENPPQPVAISAQLVQSQKMESIGTLAGGIAHDFNNIIAGILGYATYIKSLVTPDNPIHRHAATIEDQAHRAADLTQQLLAFARGGQYTLEPVDMNRVVAETVSLLSKTIDRAITLEAHTEPDLPAVEADASQMKQMLLNLAVNAKEALPQGGRIIFETRVAHLDRDFVRSCPDLRPGDHVEVVVGDTGIGMPPEVIDRVFEPFFTTKPAGEGTGLGLSAVYGIVKNHRGHVSLSSSPGIGTTFRIYLPPSGRPAPRTVAAGVRPPATKDVAAPVVPREPAATLMPSAPIDLPLEPPPEAMRAVTGGREDEVWLEAPEEETPGPAPVPQRREPATPAEKRGPDVRKRPDPSVGTAAPVAGAGRILVVDDEAAIRDLTRDILQVRGYEVILAKDGVEALDAYRQNWGRIDLVILDMVMPRLGGLETYRRLTGMDRGARVLLCSGYSHNEQTQRAIKEGALGLLSKPFTMTELLAWVERVARRKESR